MRQLYIIILINLVVSGELLGQKSYRPGLFFREDWKEIPAEIPLNQNHVENSELIVQLYGVGMDSLKKSHHENPIDDPYYVWSGLCLGNWMVTVKHKTKNVDLTEFAKIKIRTKQSGLRELRISLKLANGDWLISDQSVGSSKDWKITEFNIQDIVWHNLDANRITETGVADNSDISNVEEIGFTDLMPGGESRACSRLDWIEVYGKSILR
jgi:hypothetical protein